MNPKIIKFSHEALSRLKETKNVGIQDAYGKFISDGLYSTETFGEVGTIERMNTFSYIKLNTKVITPYLFNIIKSLSNFYYEILRGQKYAIWNEKNHIFEPSDMSEGQTGYTFFIKHVKEIEWERTNSSKRDRKIELLKKYSDKLIISNFAVLPAGMRDLIEKNGKVEEDETNPIYRKIIMLSSMLEGTEEDSEANDEIRNKLQGYIHEYFEYVMRLESGKGGIIQSQWTKRSIKDGTRNVITASTIKPKNLLTDKNLGMNDTIVNMYQYCYAIGGKLIYLTNKNIMSKFIDHQSTSVELVNKKTGEWETVPVSPEIAKLATSKGIMSILKKLKKAKNIFKPISVGKKHNLLKIYDDGNQIEVVYNKAQEMSLNRNFIRPMTYMDFFSIITLPDSDDSVALMTRYPITQQGSIYPTLLFVRPTVDICVREIVINGTPYKIPNYPVMGSMLYNSMGIHPSKLGNLSADFDGDKLSLTIVQSTNAKQEIKDLLTRRLGYITVSGNWIDSLATDISSHVLKTLTGV